MSGETIVFGGRWEERRDQSTWRPLQREPIRTFVADISRRLDGPHMADDLVDLPEDWQAEFSAATFVLLLYAAVEDGEIRSLTLDFAWTEPEDESTEEDVRAVLTLAAELGARLDAVVWFLEDDVRLDEPTKVSRVARDLAAP